MPFSESVKLEAKKRAHFACVWCRRVELVVEVHHIIREADGGLNEVENAATLCPNCHTSYGHNREFRTEMKRRRNWWWEHCSKTALPDFAPVLEQVNLHAERLAALEKRQLQTDEGFRAFQSWAAQIFPAAETTIRAAHTVTELQQATTGLWDGSTESRVRRVVLPPSLQVRGPASMLEGSVVRTSPPTPIDSPSNKSSETALSPRSEQP